MAAGLGFKSFATGEVLTAADTNGYLMQGILVFASAAARDAAITSPQEGQACYLKDTNQVLTYSGSTWVAVGGVSPLTTKGDLYTFSTVDARLPVGTNGQVLTADSSETTGLKFATPASGGGMTLLSTTTLTGASTTISSISQDYVDLKIYVVNYDPSNGDQGCSIQMNADSTANRHLRIAISTTTSTAYDAVSWEVAARASATVNQGLTVITIFKYADTTIRKTGEVWQSNIPAHTSSDNVFQRRENVFYNQTTAISSVKFIPEANTMAGGTVLIYGVK